MTTGPRLSVLIPTRQRRDLLQRSLLALAAQTLAAEAFEVVVAVDGGSDGTQAMLASFDAPYRLHVVQTGGRGRGAALNAALALAEGELVLLLDDDMEPEAQCLLTHARLHAESTRIGVVGAVPVASRPEARLAERYVARRFTRHLRKLAGESVVRPGDFYSGHFSIRRSSLAEVGGFAAAFVAYGNEDRDLAVRLADAGVRLVFAPEARALQRYTKSTAELIADHFAKGRTAVIFARRHPGAAAELPFRSYRGGSRLRRAGRRLLLAAAAAWPWLDAAVVRAGRLLEALNPPGALLVLPVLLDYAFWRGAAAARADEGGQ